MRTTIIFSSVIKKETEQFAHFSAFFGFLLSFCSGLSHGSINNDSKHICTMRVYSSAPSSSESFPAPQPTCCTTSEGSDVWLQTNNSHCQQLHAKGNSRSVRLPRPHPGQTVSRPGSEAPASSPPAPQRALILRPPGSLSRCALPLHTLRPLLSAN